jgi:hypothetical protein
LHVVHGVVNLLVRLVPVAAITVRPVSVGFALASILLLTMRSCSPSDIVSASLVPSTNKVAAPDKAASTPLAATTPSRKSVTMPPACWVSS